MSDEEDEALGGSRQVPLSRNFKGPSESEKGGDMSISDSNGQVQVRTSACHFEMILGRRCTHIISER